MLALRNPHSVLAALRCRPDAVREIRLSSNRPHGAWADVVDAAQQWGIPVRVNKHDRNDQRSGRPKRGKPEQKDRRPGSAEATVQERQPLSLEEMFSKVTGQAPFGVWLALDCVQDPHNVGSIFRSAAFFGVKGIITTKDKAAPLNATVYDVASGGVEAVPVCVVANLGVAFDRAKDAGLWILGASEHAPQPIESIPQDRSWLLTIGNEEKGLRPLTMRRCDELCRLDHRGDPAGPMTIQSLNASVATAVLLTALTASPTP